MIGAIVFFVLLFGYFGIVKGESDSLKVFLAIIGIVAVVWLIGYNGTRRNSMAEDEKLRSDGIDADEYRTQHGY